MADFDKNCGYGIDRNDFAIDQELTVTITLSEYRSLVKGVALADSDKGKLNSEIYKLRNENASLKQKIESLMFHEEEECEE